MKEWLNFTRDNQNLIDTLSKPLYSAGITTMAYFRFSSTGMVHLCNNIPWYETWMENKIYEQTARYQNEMNLLKGKKEYFLLRDHPKIKSNIENLMQFHNMSNVVSMYIQPSENIVEMFGFASNMNHNNLFNFYINNKDFLIEFSRHFRANIYPTINQLNNKHTYKTNLIIPSVKPLASITEDDFDSKLSKKIFINSNRYITKREFESLSLLSRGMSIKEIGNLLGISARTVEVYISHIKDKLHIHSTSQLIQHFHKYTF